MPGSAASAKLAKNIAGLMRCIGRPVRLMEVCGTHTVAAFRHGIRSLLPQQLTLLSGPGCPVCVTPAADVEAAIALARIPGVVITTFGDMLRVPGRCGSLASARAGGADVRAVYSPLDALALAGAEEDKEIVFVASGFETTSPLVAATLLEADRRGVELFSVICTHKLVPPALSALLEDKDSRIDGLMLPGHVSTIIGTEPYEFISRDFSTPAVVTGFESTDMLEGIELLLAQIASGDARIENQYARVVRRDGNPQARRIMNRVFETVDSDWRGIGLIRSSGLALAKDFERRDALVRFGVRRESVEDPKCCACGDVLRGVKTPRECPLFAASCTPETPVGPCMVSSEGSCAAHYRYGL